MAETKEKQPRASNGRFVKKRGVAKKSAVSARQSSKHGDASSGPPGAVRHRPSVQREGSVRLALLTLAILFAAIGFALPFLWVGAIVLMGVLWGAMIAERPRREATVTGLVTEMVTAVVDEAKDVAGPARSDSAVAPVDGDDEPGA